MTKKVGGFIKQNLIVDYLVMSFKISDRDNSFTSWLTWFYEYIKFPVDDAESIKSYYGLRSCLFYKGIKIHADNELVVLDMSGKGCRTFESLNPDLDWYKFLISFDEWIVNRDTDTKLYNVHISRLDVACDLLEDERLTVDKLQGYVMKNKFLCKSNYHSCVVGNYENAVYFGSPRSDRRLRIYDKALEQGIVNVKWVRFEFQLRNDNATSFYLNLKELKGDFAKCYHGMLHDYLRFITEPNNDNHSERKHVCKWWMEFLGGVKRIKQLYLPAEAYDLGKVTHVYKHQCASTVRTLMEANGGDVTELLNTAMETKLNKKQKDLLSDISVKQKADEAEQAKRDALFEKIVGNAPRMLTRQQRMAFMVADRDERKYQDRLNNWVPFCVNNEEQQTMDKLKNEKELLEQDLSF